MKCEKREIIMNNNAALWKTCRVLANKTRLDILQNLMCNAERCVLHVARANNLTEVVASQHLRLLHEHGFLQVERKSKWTFYRAGAPLKGSYAEHIFEPLKKRLMSKNSSKDDILRLFTAFTHPRRIEIAKALLIRDHKFEELISACDISRQALYRHLDKLISRNFISQNNGAYQIIRSRKGLKKVLLDACETTPFSHTS